MFAGKEVQLFMNGKLRCEAIKKAVQQHIKDGSGEEIKPSFPVEFLIAGSWPMVEYFCATIVWNKMLYDFYKQLLSITFVFLKLSDCLLYFKRKNVHVLKHV